MGFFSKVWKGVKKTFKKIGKGIKKAFKSVGKFMGKIGILGNIALVLLTGGLGIGGMFTSLGTKLGALSQTMSGPLAAIMKGASWTIGKAAQFGTAVKSGFSTLTKGVTEFFGQTAKYVGNKLGMNIQGAPTNLGEVWSNTSKAVSDQFKVFKGDVGDLFTKTSPTLEAGKLGMSYEDFKNTNSFGRDLSDLDDGFDLVKEGDVKTLTLDDMGIPTSSTGVVDQAAATAGTQQSLLQKITDPQTYVQGAKDIITETPGAAVKSVATQALTSLIMPPDGYSPAPSFESYAPQFASQDYGAVQQGLTPMATDGYQDMVFAYDALGQQSGGYGGLYKQRLGAFA
jgi:hypothetical protein